MAPVSLPSMHEDAVGKCRRVVGSHPQCRLSNSKLQPTFSHVPGESDEDDHSVHVDKLVLLDNALQSEKSPALSLRQLHLSMPV